MDLRLQSACFLRVIDKFHDFFAGFFAIKMADAVGFEKNLLALGHNKSLVN